MVKSNTITESIHKPAIRSKLILPAILISDTTSTLTSNPSNKSMKQSRTCPEIDKNNNSILGVEYEGVKTSDEPMLENVHELMLPATAASISKLRSNSFKNRVKQTRRPSSLFPLRPPTTPSPLEAMIASSSSNNTSKPPTPTTIMLNIGGKSMRSSIKSIKSIKSVRINPDSSKEADQHKSSNVEDSTSPTKVNDADDADELRSFRTLHSNKSSILRRSYSSHKSNNSSKSHGSSRSRTNKYSRSSKYASKNGMDDQYEDEDEEMIVSQI